MVLLIELSVIEISSQYRSALRTETGSHQFKVFRYSPVKVIGIGKCSNFKSLNLLLDSICAVMQELKHIQGIVNNLVSSLTNCVAINTM